MNSSIVEDHKTDAYGNPAGGETLGRGIKITWQDGPLGVGDPEMPGGATIRTPNGAFVEEVIAAAIGRLEHYNSTRFRCRENSLAITKLEEAVHWLQHRTADREARDVEGTHRL
jgi:hypothetical protein